jgi:hypothetical protein
LLLKSDLQVRYLTYTYITPEYTPEGVGCKGIFEFSIKCLQLTKIMKKIYLYI